MNVTEEILAPKARAMPQTIIYLIVTMSFLIGIIGNSSALVILYRSAKRRNKKHVLMLRWLACNDLTAAIGMLIITNLKRYSTGLSEFWICAFFTILRGFGFGSGIVALIMALERWFALTRPFLYHKLVTYDVLKRTLCCLWLANLFFTYSPLYGFGLYWDSDCPAGQKCRRYRLGVSTTDSIFAWLNFAVGTLVCLSIALCNIAVVLELSKIRSQNRVLVRRISRSIIVNNRTGYTRHHQTPEEVAFAKLMAYISVIFCVCWGPQIILIPIAQLGVTSKAAAFLEKIADMLLAIYFALDPIVYVLQRYLEKGSLGFTCCFLRRRQSTSSLPTTTTTAAGGTTPTAVLIPPLTYPAPPSA